MLKDNTDEHVTVTDTDAGNTAVSLRTTVENKKIAHQDKEQDDLTAYVPPFEINKSGNLKFTHAMSEEGIGNRIQLTKVVNRKRATYAIAGLAPFEALFAGLLASGILPETTMVVPVGVNFMCGLLIIAVCSSAIAIPKRLIPVINVFIPKIQEWLQEGYGLTVSDKTARRIVFKMLLSNASTMEHINFKTIDKKPYLIYKKDDKYSVYRPSNGRWWDMSYAGEHKNEPATNPTVNVNLEETSNINIPSFTPEVAEQQTFLNKVTLLEKQALTSEEQHVVNRAKQEAQAAHNAATALTMLGSDLHTETLSEVFTLLNTELDTIINIRQETMHAQLKLSKEVIQERSSKPFTLA